MFPWHIRSPFDPQQRALRRSVTVLYAPSKTHHSHQTSHTPPAIIPKLDETQKWRDLYIAEPSRPLPSGLSNTVWPSGSNWGVNELAALHVIPVLHQTPSAVLGEFHLHSAPGHKGGYQYLKYIINNSGGKDDSFAIPDLPTSAQVSMLRARRHPFALFYSRLIQMSSARRGVGLRTTRYSKKWNGDQHEVRPDSFPAPSFQAPTQTPEKGRRSPMDWEKDDPFSSPLSQSISTRRRLSPPPFARSSASHPLPSMQHLLPTDEAHTWALLDTLLSSTLETLYEKGWSRLYDDGDAAARFSFEYQFVSRLNLPPSRAYFSGTRPKQQLFSLRLGRASCTAITDGGICLTNNQLLAIDLEHPCVVIECKRHNSTVQPGNLFAQVFAEMLGAAQAHHALAPKTRDTPSKSPASDREELFALLLRGYDLSFVRADFSHSYLNHLSLKRNLPEHTVQEVLSTSPAKLSARGGRTAAIDGLARLVYTLRTRYTTSLMRGYFDAEDRMVGLEDLYY